MIFGVLTAEKNWH